MTDKTMTQGISPLGIRITGNGAYVKDQLIHLQDFMDYVEHDRLEEIRRDTEQ